MHFFKASEPRFPRARGNGVLVFSGIAARVSLAAFAALIPSPGCPGPQPDPAPPQAPSDTPPARPADAVLAYVGAMNGEDIDRVLRAVHPDSEVAKSIAETARFFGSYEVRYEIESLEVAGEQDESSTVNLVLVSKRVPGKGLPFMDNRCKVECKLRKHDGTWKVLTFAYGEAEYLR